METHMPLGSGEYFLWNRCS